MAHHEDTTERESVYSPFFFTEKNERNAIYHRGHRDTIVNV